MVPFVSIEIVQIMKNCMPHFITRTVMKKVNTPYEVQQLDIEKSENLGIIQAIKLTTATAEELVKVSSNLHDDLKKSFSKILQAFVKKSMKEVLCSANVSRRCLLKPSQFCHN